MLESQRTNHSVKYWGAFTDGALPHLDSLKHGCCQCELRRVRRLLEEVRNFSRCPLFQLESEC